MIVSVPFALQVRSLQGLVKLETALARRTVCCAQVKQLKSEKLFPCSNGNLKDSNACASTTLSWPLSTSKVLFLATPKTSTVLIFLPDGDGAKHSLHDRHALWAKRGKRDISRRVRHNREERDKLGKRKIKRLFTVHCSCCSAHLCPQILTARGDVKRTNQNTIHYRAKIVTCLARSVCIAVEMRS